MYLGNSPVIKDKLIYYLHLIVVLKRLIIDQHIVSIKHNYVHNILNFL